MMDSPPSPPVHILVIEDDAGIASVLQRGLGLRGWTVTVARHGVAGRHAWQAGAYDVAIVDVMLPGVNGVELLVERRAAGDRTPVLLLTARDEEAYRAQGRAAGADEYLTKPFAYDALMAILDRLISGGRSARSDDRQ
jgi:DNA-binding response OmpR family regulator